jgi:hypothetical protein
MLKYQMRLQEQTTMQLTSKYIFERFHSSLGYKKPMNVYLEGMRKELGKVA